MRTKFLILCFLIPAGILFNTSTSFAQSKAILKGAIDKYKIEMELSAGEKGAVKGKYRYAGKTAYLDLTGELHGKEVLFLEEYYKDEKTGTFYLEWTNEGNWQGKWIAGKKVFEVVMNFTSGGMEELGAYELSDFPDQVSQ